MTLTFVAFHLNLTQHLHSSARPLPCASWGKRFGRSGCSEPQRDTAIFFTTRGGGRSVVELENTRRPSSSFVYCTRERTFTPHCTLRKQRNSSLKDLFRRHTAALCPLCSRFLQPLSYSRQVLRFAAPPVLNINSLDRAKQYFSILDATNPFLHPISTVAT